MANEFIIKNGFFSQGNSEITGSLNVTGGITGSFSGSLSAPGSTTQIVYNNGGVLDANTGFVYSGSRVGIGTTTPNTTLEVNGVIRTPQMSIGGLDSGRNQFLTYTSGPVYRMFAGGAYASLGISSLSVGSTYASDSGSTNTVRIEGNTSIGTLTSPARLAVRGSGATSATTTLLIQNSNNSASLVVLDNGFVGIGTGSATYPLEVSGSARVNGTLQTNYLSFRTADSLTAIYPTDDGFNPAINGNLLRFQSNTLAVARYGYNFRNATGTRSWTSGTGGDIVIASIYAPTSGTGIFNTLFLETTINQTGGANGITRGLHVSPTLTAAADFRAIENTIGNNLFNTISGNTYVGLSTNTGTSRLQVRGSGATSATTTFHLQNSTPTNLMTVLDNGQTTFSSPIISLATSQSAFTISQSISASNTVGGQYYGVNITPTFFATTASQTETALRVAATFTGSTAAVGGQNIIADFGATSAGSQFTVTDVTSGSIYMVNDVSGLPIIEATSDWTVNMYNFPNKIFEKTGSQVNIYGTLQVSGSFILPLSQSTTPQIGSAYWSGSFLFIYDGTQYRSASFA